jgi:hypothetical protein
MSYTIEEIPDPDHVFRAVHKTWFKNGLINSGKSFKFDKDGCSVAWEKYSSANKAREINSRNPPSDYGVAALIAGNIRTLDLDVLHDPLPTNRAHSLITPHRKEDEDIKEYQEMLLKQCNIVLLPGIR